MLELSGRGDDEIPVRWLSTAAAHAKLAAGLSRPHAGSALVLTPLGTNFERTFGLDWLFKIRGARKPPPDVAVVGISSETGRALGLPR